SYDTKGQHTRAIADFTQALALDPKNAEAYYNRGVAYDGAEDQRDLDIADYTHALERYPKDAMAYLMRGNASDTEGQHNLSRADYTQALELDPERVMKFIQYARPRDAKLIDFVKQKIRELNQYQQSPARGKPQ